MCVCVCVCVRARARVHVYVYVWTRPYELLEGCRISGLQDLAVRRGRSLFPAVNRTETLTGRPTMLQLFYDILHVTTPQN